MTLLPAFLRTPSRRRVDVGLTLAVLANALLLAALALASAASQAIDFTGPVALVCGAVLLVQAVLLLAVAWHQGHRAERQLDIERLVKAMGASGPIRLDPAKVRAESAPGLRLKHMQQRMAAALHQVHRSAQTLRQAAQVLDQSGEHLGQRGERSAKGLRDIATTIGQVSVILQASAQAAQEARTTAASATAQAEEGGAQLQLMAQRLHEIDQALRRAAELAALAGGAGGIARRADTPAPDAADTAAAEIQSLIGAATEAVREGHEIAALAGQRLRQLVASVHQVDEHCQRLSAGTHQHAGSLLTVTPAVKALDAMTRQNVGAGETARRIAHTLVQQGAQLDKVLGAFELGGQPAAAAQAASVPASAEAPASAPPKLATDRSAARKLAAAAIQAAAKPAAPTTPPAPPANRIRP